MITIAHIPTKQQAPIVEALVALVLTNAIEGHRIR
jgi:hypothetical protein